MARMLLALLATLALTGPAIPHHLYAIVGSDDYRVGHPGTNAHIDYRGHERLTIQRKGSTSRYTVQVTYRRTGDDGVAEANARFVQVYSPKSGLQDVSDEDPDFLTILNQPFAIQLDPPTLGDLRALRGPVPFDATSPLGGNAVLRGFLRPGTGGRVAGIDTVAVRFQAAGVMAGPLPTQSSAHMTGQMQMTGTAYYSIRTALLLALDARLTIVAQLHGVNGNVPVHIVYRRFIRAIKTLPPTPLPSDAVTASPAAPSKA